MTQPGFIRQNTYDDKPKLPPRGPSLPKYNQLHKINSFRDGHQSGFPHMKNLSGSNPGPLKADPGYRPNETKFSTTPLGDQF